MLFANRTIRHLASLAIGLGALAAPASAFAQDAAQTDSGFGLEANLGARITFATAGTPNPPTSGAVPLAGLSAGYKTGRIYIGVGLEFSNNSFTQTMGMNPVRSVTTSSSNFLIGPDFQAALVRSSDNRVELIADLGLHFGHQFQSISTNPPVNLGNAPTDSNFLLSYRIAPGVRFWAHSHFALQAVTGFGGDAFIVLPAGAAPMGGNGNNSNHGIFTTVGALGVF